MKKYFFAVTVICLNACSNNNKSAEVPDKPADEKLSFFPVTAYFKGQIYDIKQKGLTPIKYTTINNHTDSVMIKLDFLNKEVTGFLNPVIDSTNLISLFTESKFLDQTIDAFTFTYDAKTILPDSIPLLHWDVYITPESGKVQRIYMIKKGSGNKTFQLTWQSDKWFKTVTILNKADGTAVVEKEEKISWDY